MKEQRSDINDDIKAKEKQIDKLNKEIDNGFVHEEVKDQFDLEGVLQSSQR